MAKHDHVLSNGYTYLAVTAGHYGSWAKATDPMTAIRNAADEAGVGELGKILVMCVYAKNGSVRCGSMGGIYWDEGAEPVPVGLFTVTPRSITATKKGDVRGVHEDCAEWIETVLRDIRESLAA